MKEIKTLYQTKWISLRSIEDKEKGIPPYIYKHVEAYDGLVVAVLPWRWNKEGKVEILVVNEMRPCWDTKELEMKFYSSITGGVEKLEEIQTAALREFNEETPYRIPPEKFKRFKYLGTTFTAKSSDTIVHLWSVEILRSDKKHKNTGGDGSHMEKTAVPTWIRVDSVGFVHDPLIAQMVVRCFPNLLRF